jgi:hypothetical protein
MEQGKKTVRSLWRSGYDTLPAHRHTGYPFAGSGGQGCPPSVTLPHEAPPPILLIPEYPEDPYVKMLRDAYSGLAIAVLAAVSRMTNDRVTPFDRDPVLFLASGTVVGASMGWWLDRCPSNSCYTVVRKHKRDLFPAGVPSKAPSFRER